MAAVAESSRWLPRRRSLSRVPVCCTTVAKTTTKRPAAYSHAAMPNAKRSGAARRAKSVSPLSPSPPVDVLDRTGQLGPPRGLFLPARRGPGGGGGAKSTEDEPGLAQQPHVAQLGSGRVKAAAERLKDLLVTHCEARGKPAERWPPRVAHPPSDHLEPTRAHLDQASYRGS